MEANRQNWDAEDYARNSSAQLEWATELMAKLALKGDEAILDIGCGDGKITAELARHLPRGLVKRFTQTRFNVRHTSFAAPPVFARRCWLRW